MFLKFRNVNFLILCCIGGEEFYPTEQSHERRILFTRNSVGSRVRPGGRSFEAERGEGREKGKVIGRVSWEN